MADTTTRYGWPYQEATDPPAGHELGQDLAEAIEADLGTIEDAHDARLDVLEARILTAFKTADETLSSNAAAQDDNHLFVSVAANATYLVEGWVRYVSASTSSDMRVNWSYPAGASFARNDFGTATAAALVAAEPLDMTVLTAGDNGRGASTAERGLNVMGYLKTAGTAGTFRFRWSQVVSSVDSLTVKEGSWIKLTKVT